MVKIHLSVLIFYFLFSTNLVATTEGYSNATWDGEKWFNDTFEWLPPGSWTKGITVPFSQVNVRGVYTIQKPDYTLSGQLMILASGFAGGASFTENWLAGQG